MTKQVKFYCNIHDFNFFRIITLSKNSNPPQDNVFWVFTFGFSLGYADYSTTIRLDWYEKKLFF